MPASWAVWGAAAGGGPAVPPCPWGGEGHGLRRCFVLPRVYLLLFLFSPINCPVVRQGSFLSALKAVVPRRGFTGR